MRVSRIVLTILFAGVLCLPGQEEAKLEEKKKLSEPQRPIAFLDLKNSADGSYPGGATPLSGKWFIDAGVKKLKIAPEPLVRGRLEFGPEIREKGGDDSGSRLRPVEWKVEVSLRGRSLRKEWLPTSSRVRNEADRTRSSRNRPHENSVYM